MSGISVVINALDEERRLPFALRSVQRWAAEVVVVDMESTDRTAEFARGFGARVVSHPRTGFVEPARAFAVAQATQPWVLVLDADELVPPTLAERLVELSWRTDIDAVRIARLNYVCGEPLAHTGWNPSRDRHWRFFRRGCVSFGDALHAPPSPVAGARGLELPAEPGLLLVHFNYLDLGHVLSKLDTYSAIEARQARAAGRSPSMARAVGDALRELLVRYAWHGGWRDGWRGVVMAATAAYGHLLREGRMIEPPRDVAEAAYAREAERWLGSTSSE